MSEATYPAWICPECATGKCRNCDGNAWDDEKDDLTPCTCKHETEDDDEH